MAVHHYRDNYKQSFFRKFFPLTITLAFLLSLVVFLFWVATVFLPVASVEISYQAKKVFTSAFGVSDLRALLIPRFKITINEVSKHPEGGVVIPALYLDEPVVYNVDPNDSDAYTLALKQGIAHASSTRLPDNGGLGYYFAHSSSPSLARQYNAVFYLLGKLNGGERITLWHNGKRSDYKVSKKEITVPDDVRFLNTPYDKETIVLQTCWPPGTAERRLLVFAERVEE